jgi:hypothetical protein
MPPHSPKKPSPPLAALLQVDGQEVEEWTLADSKQAWEPDVANSFGEPERVNVARSRLRAASGKFEYRFPALTLTVLRWQVGK